MKKKAWITLCVVMTVAILLSFPVSAKALSRDARESLSEEVKALYDYLREQIEALLQTGGTMEITIPESIIGYDALKVSAQEVGGIVDASGKITQEAIDRLNEKIEAICDSAERALMDDDPDLFSWCHSTYSVYSRVYTKDEMWVGAGTIRMCYNVFEQYGKGTTLSPEGAALARTKITTASNSADSASVRESLSAEGKAFYDYLREQIEALLQTGGTMEITIPESIIGYDALKVSAQEVGGIVDASGKITQEAIDRLNEKIKAICDSAERALMDDDPDLFSWCHSTYSVYSRVYTKDEMWVGAGTIRMCYNVFEQYGEGTTLSPEGAALARTKITAVSKEDNVPPVAEGEPSDKDKTLPVPGSATEARNGVVRILAVDDIDNPSYFSTGSGFGVGIIGEETNIFVTNRHVVYDEQKNDIASNIYILLDDDAAKQVYSSFGEFYNEDVGRRFKIVFNKAHMVKCEVLYPTNNDPVYPDIAIIRAIKPIEGRTALPLLRTEEVPDATPVWTIGYPGSADKLYNYDSRWDEMKYEADVDGAQLFAGTISRRGSMKSLDNTAALTHNAQIDHGNSGGPLVIQDGQVIGINTYGFDSSQTASVGYYLSIYIDYAMDQLDKLGIQYNLTSGDGQAYVNTPADQPSESSKDARSTKEVLLCQKYVSYDEKYDKRGVYYYTKEYTYNEYGEEIQSDFHYADGSTTRYETAYDDHGNRIAEIRYKDDVFDRRIEWIYDDGERLLYKNTYDGKGDLKYYEEYTYDSDGILISKFDTFLDRLTYYYPDGNERKAYIHYASNSKFDKRSIEEYDYDANGKLTKVLEMNEEGVMIEYTEYLRDETGNCLGWFFYGEDGNLKHFAECLFDEKYQEIGTVFYDKDGNISSYNKKEYNRYGDCTSSVDYTKDGQVSSSWVYTYEYDDNRNILKKTIYCDDMLYSVTYNTLLEVYERE